MSVASIVTRVLHFSGKVFVFGLAVGFAITGIFAAVSWYNNRRVSATIYPEFPIVANGIKYQVTTKWQDGKIYYKFKVFPFDKTLTTEFDKAATSNAPKSFVVHLGDSGSFAILGCEVDISSLTPVIGDDGLVESMEAEGSSNLCSRWEYLEIRSIYPTYVFPTVKKEVSSPTAHGPWENYAPPPKPKNESPVGLNADVTCDVVVFDRDQFASGDPQAIGTLHSGDTVRYLGHVTVSAADIIQFHGRRGYVDSTNLETCDGNIRFHVVTPSLQS